MDLIRFLCTSFHTTLCQYLPGTPTDLQWPHCLLSPLRDRLNLDYNCVVNGTQNQYDLCHDMFTKWHYRHIYPFYVKMDFPIPINWISPIRILGASGVNFIFLFQFRLNFFKQIV